MSPLLYSLVSLSHHRHLTADLDALVVVSVLGVAGRASSASGAASPPVTTALSPLGNGAASGLGGDGSTGRGDESGGGLRLGLNGGAATAVGAAREDGWAGDGVGVEVAVDIGGVAGVGGLEGTGDSNTGWVHAATTSDLDLGAGDVKLGSTGGVWVVDAEGLDAEKVLSVGDAAGKLSSVGTSESPLAAGEGRAPVLDLEPGAAAVVAGS